MRTENFLFTVCQNMSGEKFNIFGVRENCGQRFNASEESNICAPGYTGDRCEFCTFGYFPTQGSPGKVNDETNQGVSCHSEFLFIDLILIFTIIVESLLSTIVMKPVVTSNQISGLLYVCFII